MTVTECRAGCGVPLDKVLVAPDGPGLHPTCLAAPRPVLPLVREVLERCQAGQDRSRQRHIGPSQLGHPCDRHIAYRLLTEPRPEPLKYAALLGSWDHAGIAEAFSMENARLGRQRYLIEQRVELEHPLVPGGCCDLFDTDTGECVDWKFPGKTTLDGYRRAGYPGDVYRIQLHVYGYGWELAGHQVQSVRVAMLPRASHTLADAWEWAEPYNRELAALALERVSAIHRVATALDVMSRPNLMSLIHCTPGEPTSRNGVPTGKNCVYCPWLRQWPEPDGPATADGCPGH